MNVYSVYVNNKTANTPDCFGAPYVCSHGEVICHNCDSRMDCAETAVLMVHAVASRKLTLEGVTSETIQFANSVSSFLPKDFELSLGRPYPPAIELIKYCHGRSKHLITAAKISEPLDAELEEVLRGLDEPPPAPSNAASAISIQLTPQSESELTDDATNEATSCLEATVKISDSAPACLPAPTALNQSSVNEIEVTVASKELVTVYPSIPLDLRNLSHDSLLLRSIKLDSTIPPRFRKVKGGVPFNVSGIYSFEETQALQQRQLDDLVYLSKQGRSRSVHKKYEGIFTSDGELNLALAGTFLTEKAWSLDEKTCKLLKLTEFEQLQCRALASKKINDKWRNSLKHAAKIEEKLNAIADKDEQFRQYVSDFTLLEQAIYLCNGWATKTLPLVFGWLTGKEPISRQGITAKVTRLNKRLGRKGA